jgi:flavin reductase (DIM6/NTAB) family NADH-FMN oxidoreductase RutF
MDGLDGGTQGFPLSACGFISFQPPLVCVSQPKVLTSSMVSSTYIPVYRVARQLKGNLIVN